MLSNRNLSLCHDKTSIGHWLTTSYCKTQTGKYNLNRGKKIENEGLYLTEIINKLYSHE